MNKSISMSLFCFPLLISTASYAGDTLSEGATPYHEAKSIVSKSAVKVDYNEMVTIRALPLYHEPKFMDKLVAEGKLPPIKERLPKEPIVFEKGAIPDDIGVYGGALRHMTGDRPQGWNWMAMQSQGYGGSNMTIQMCLVDTGPMYRLKQSELRPLPNLARSWDWNKDKTELTIHLLEGAKWSDGQPFDTEDIRFFWEDNIVDPNVPTYVAKDFLGEGVELKIIDPYSFKFVFHKNKNVHAIYALSYPNFCPGPSHILKKFHPKYNKSSSYIAYNHALKPDVLPWVTMGPWVATQYKPDEMAVYRRNPYYFKVDYKGNQLPYLNEMQMRFETYEARTINTLGGTIDFSNVERLGNYTTVAKELAKPDRKANITWGPRLQAYQLWLNKSTSVGIKQPEDIVYRELNQNLKFRKAISFAIDRQSLINSLARGPFAVPWYGGLSVESPYYTKGSTVAYPYNPTLAKKYLADLGFKDTNGDGLLNFTDGPLKGKDLSFSMMIDTGQDQKAVADTLAIMLHEVGLKVTVKQIQSSTIDVALTFDFILKRDPFTNTAPILYLDRIAATAPTAPAWHMGTKEKPQVLQPYEQELVSIVRKLQNTDDNDEIIKLFAQYQHVFTENLDYIGLYESTVGLLSNRDLKNVPAAPAYLYQWAELGAIRDLWWTPIDKQKQELYPNTLPTYK